MKKKIKFYKSLLIELIETLCTICLVLDRITSRGHYKDGIHIHSHFLQLKEYSKELRGQKYE